MRSRSREGLQWILPVVAVAVATSGCGLLKKKKKVDPDPTGDVGATATGDFTAINKAQIVRFADERKIAAEPGFVRQLATVRTAPNEAGETVGLIDPDKLVTKYADRSGYTLVTFDRVGAQIGTKWAGWIPDAAFSQTAQMPVAPPTATAAATVAATGVGTAPKPTSANDPVNAAPSATGTSDTGTCRMTLKSTSFTPSSSTCSFNEKVRSNPAVMTFPCAGGTARAAFGSQLFTGSADKTKVALSHAATFQFKECTVRSVQNITGSPPNLTYSYSEQIAGGNCKNVGMCTARGSISAAP